jgi:uncharacterized protein
MMARKLQKEEKELIKKMLVFVKKVHANSEGHSYSHVSQVTEVSIEIAKRIPERVDPFIVICGAIFHDIGRVNREFGTLHGLEGAAIAEEYLEAVGLKKECIEEITRIIARHTPTSMLDPKTVEEKIVFDADALDRLGWIGVLRGLLGKRGSIEEIFYRVIKKRREDYDRLHFEVSRELGKKDNEDLEHLIRELEKALERRIEEVEKIEFLDED